VRLSREPQAAFQRNLRLRRGGEESRRMRIDIVRRLPGSLLPVYILGLFLLVGFLGTISYWDLAEFNLAAYVFVVFWHGLILYWMFGYLRRDDWLSHTTVELDNETVRVNRRFVRRTVGDETIPLSEITELRVVREEGFNAVLFPDDPKFIDFGDPREAEMIIRGIVGINRGIRVVGLDAEAQYGGNRGGAASEEPTR
jgi:hypothetical protein